VEVDLRHEAESVVDFLAPLAQERAIRVELHGTAIVVADRMLVRRALTNLLVNALRHADTQFPVCIELVRSPQVGIVRVINRGTAIPSDQLSRIFDRFVRLDAARDRASGGTGLGLSIVASIMKLHAGSAAAESDALRGETTFTLAFPTEGPVRSAVGNVSQSGRYGFPSPGTRG
jgi:two-component system heavy metal sensor histidine kinase CusS